MKRADNNQETMDLPLFMKDGSSATWNHTKYVEETSTTPQGGEQMDVISAPGIIDNSNELLNNNDAQLFITTSLMALNTVAIVIFIVSCVGLVNKDAEWTMIVGTSLGIAFWGFFLFVSAFVFFAAAGGQSRGLPIIRNSNHRTTNLIEQYLASTRNLAFVAMILSIVTGNFLNLSALSSCGPYWLAAAYHVLGLVGVFVALLVWYCLPRVVLHTIIKNNNNVNGIDDRLVNSRHLRPLRMWLVPIVLFFTVLVPWGGTWLVAWILLKPIEPIDMSMYPDASTSPYKLPYPEGEMTCFVQGNNARLTHNNYAKFAYDFLLPCGSPVVASRSGYVSWVEDDFDGNILSRQARGNSVEIDHGDGTFGIYHHNQRKSAIVNVGDYVEQGQQIANVGNTGTTLAPHVHFEVRSSSQIEAVPITFRDISENDDGIPRSLSGCYKSRNKMRSA